jgi:outer membrane immunogenic protein
MLLEYPDIRILKPTVTLMLQPNRETRCIWQRCSSGARVNKSLLGALVLAMTCGTALAADLAPVPSEPVAPVAAPYNWTGFYAGLQAAYGWGKSDAKNTHDTDGVLEYTGTVNSDGFSGGGYVGANYQFGNTGFVVGAEVDAKFGAIDGKDALIGVGPSLGRPDSPTSTRITWDGAARLRLGYAFDRFLPYIAGGVAGADFRWRPFYPTDHAVPHDDTMWGWTIGGGLEYAITDNLIARVEYRYSDYGDVRKIDYKPGAIADGGYHDSANLKTNDVRIGVSYKF